MVVSHAMCFVRIDIYSSMNATWSSVPGVVLLDLHHVWINNKMPELRIHALSIFQYNLKHEEKSPLHSLFPYDNQLTSVILL